MIEQTLNKKLTGALQAHLWSMLQLSKPDAHERVAQLMSEDPSVAQRRAELEAKKLRLEEIAAKLSALRL
jgi:hypothetical protein